MSFKRLGYTAAALLLLASSVLGIGTTRIAHAAATNLITNPSAETTDGSGNVLNWTPNTWGTSNTTLTSTSDAHTGTKALNINSTSRTNGDAKWAPDAAPVTGGTTYTYSDYSKATVATELDAAYTDANGAVSYAYLTSVQPSSSWQFNTIDFKTPSTAVKVSILHILATAGSLTTDDFSLTTQSTVVLPPPTSGNLIANPSMETANGAAPANWQKDGWGTNTSSYTYVTNGGHSGTASALVKTTAYTSGDAKWYFNPVTIQQSTTYTFSDYYISNIGTSLVAQYDNGSGSLSYVALATVPASSSWNQASVTFTTPATAKIMTVFHLIGGVGSLQTDDASLTVPAPSTNPTVALTAPLNGNTVSGSLNVSATASGPNGVASVQFMLDGANLGSAVTASPYQVGWNTTTATNGSHTLSAVVTDTKGVTATATPVSVTVNNQAAPGSNMIPNPSVETVNPTNTSLPQSWTHGSWGKNTVSFTYPTTGHTGTRSVKTQISSYSTGAAYWYSTPVAVTPGQTYDFKDYYKSNVMTNYDADLIMADGSEQDLYLGEAFASPNSWTKFETQFVVPANVVSLTILHDIFQVGYVQSDDYSLTPFSYQGFNRALVSITDDDGYDDFYTNGLPILQKYGLPSTAYIISGEVNDTAAGYITTAHLKSLYNAGVEIGSHSVTHPDLSTLSATKQDNELKNSQTALQTLLGIPIVNYAAPYGAYNQQIVDDSVKYYQSYRGVEAGFNAKNNFDVNNIMVQNILDTTTAAQVKAWVAQAQATNTWLVLVYHQINPSTATGTYNTYPADFDAQMAAIKNSGVTVKTVKDALAELKPQL